MIKRLFISLSLIASCCIFCSHEFWLQPDKFIYQRGEAVNVKFLVGEKFDGENWNGNKEKINSLLFYFGGVKDDISPQMSNDKGDSLQFALYDEGTAMLTFNSTNSFIELEPEKFNAYLQEDSITNAIEYRKEHNQTDSAGHEYYQRSVKTIIQVGSKKDNFCLQTTTLPLDIIPLTNPYTLKQGDSLSVKINFNGQPLANQLIKLWYREDTAIFNPQLITDENGLIRFPVSLNGKWMISTVKMEHLDNDPKADWQSYWATMTWGYD
jgi:uncharacterized GH25 family protein